MIPSQKHLFNIPQDITYLNCAYLSPQLRAVTEAGINGVASKEQPWRLTPPDFFTLTEQTRALFAELIGARTDDIAIIPAASYGVSVAARNINLAPEKDIVILEDQFPSNVYSWRELAKEKGVTAIVDCGVAPGVSNLGLTWENRFPTGNITTNDGNGDVHDGIWQLDENHSQPPD